MSAETKAHNHNQDRFVIIMAGGRGERFWPLSREKMPKQLLALLGQKSFLQEAVERVLPLVPANTAQWLADNLKNALVINIILAVFNMLPIPPLDGGRVAVGLLPKWLGDPLSRLEPFGMLILIGILILLPLVGAQFGLNLDVISAILRTATGYVLRLLLFLTGNA